MKFLIISLLFTFTFSQSSIFKGKVIDENKQPLAYVNVFIEGELDGAMTDESGMFKFSTKLKGSYKLVASMVGYSKYSASIDIKANETYEIDINLKLTAIELKSAVVTGSSFSSEEGKGLVVSQIDVFTTPGGAADIFQSIKTFPGMTQVSESAELYVRGGNPIESITIIDQAPIHHPFTYESNYGGLFSNLKTSFFKGIYFTSGGFSAKYGNVLSGVLDVETIDVPQSRNYSIGISMANLDFDINQPIVDNKFGFAFSGQKSNTRPLMWLNGSLDRFTAVPVSWNLTGSTSFKYSKTGLIKFFGNYASDEQGVKVDRSEYNGIFNGQSTNRFFNLVQRDILMEKIVIKNSISLNNFDNNWKLGVLDLTMKDQKIQFRNDIEYFLNSEFRILGGFEFSEREMRYIGKVPKDEYDIRPDAEKIVLDDKLLIGHLGGYLEIEKSNLLNEKNLFIVAGLRFDNFAKFKRSWIDPRLTIGYRLTENSSLKFGTGIFHQLPDPRLYSAADGNPNLKEMKATHVILSYDYSPNEYTGIKIESYYKKYSNLPYENENLNYDNSGYGTAKGFDIMLKGRLPFDVEGWISYGYIDTERKWMDYDQLRRSDYDITHNLTIVTKYSITPLWQVGLNYKIATGRPFTPIIGSNLVESKDIYEPIYGATNSDSYPTYQRLDTRLSYYTSFFSNKFSIVYLEVLNILNISNLNSYTYSKDYLTKEKVESFFGRRTIVLGANISF